jgi:transcription termination factor Rho
MPPKTTKKKTTKKASSENQADADLVKEESGTDSNPKAVQTDRELEDETQERFEKAKKSDLTVRDLEKYEMDELHKLADQEGVKNYKDLKKQPLIFEILEKHSSAQGLMYGEGVLEILPDGFGFLRSPEFSYLACPDDIYVSPSQIRRFGLKVGHVVAGTIRPPKESERYFALLRVDAINGEAPDHLNDLKDFDDLTPLHPYERFVMETPGDDSNFEMRIVDMVAPVGKGQRGLIVAPPRTGKTVLLQKMAKSVIKNYPNCKVFVLLIDERPEEVTDFKNNTPDEVEVVASTFDENSTRHVQVCEMVIEKSRRMVEYGHDVVILMDSITRMARAYNSEMPHSGKILTGGLDSNALQRPKKFFGSARAIENGGSLTILATALVDTGSKADDIIFEEFKGTGNSELHLDRRLVEKRVYPAIDIAASGTRREELLMDAMELKLVYRLRKVLADMNVVEAMELLKSRLMKFPTNAEFLLNMSKE